MIFLNFAKKAFMELVSKLAHPRPFSSEGEKGAKYWDRFLKSRCCKSFTWHCLLLGLACCEPVWSQETSSVLDWIRQTAVVFDDSTTDFGTMEQQFAKARVIALGEATHGQHEVFEIKRQLTLHLIRKHGIRLVAYEESASQMLKANEYDSGRSDDRHQAMKGFGMLIWQIEENATLLDDLRKWNLNSAEKDKVRLIGCDCQDSNALAKDGTWGFRRYRLSPAPERSLEWTLSASGYDRFLLNLRNSPQSDTIQTWINSGHGQLWFGGYSVSDDCDEQTRDVSRLIPTTPAKDFDCLVYVNKTQSARPLDPKLISR